MRGLSFSKTKTLAMPKRGEPLSLSEEEMGLLSRRARGAKRRGVALMGTGAASLLVFPALMSAAQHALALFGIESPGLGSAIGFLAPIAIMSAGVIVHEKSNNALRRCERLSESYPDDQALAASLIRELPEARQIARRASDRGRELRVMDLELMLLARDAKAARRAGKTLGRLQKSPATLPPNPTEESP